MKYPYSKTRMKKLKALLLGEISEYLFGVFGSKDICMSASFLVSECLKLVNIPNQRIGVFCMFANNKAYSMFKEKGLDALIEKMKNKKDESYWTVSIGKDPFRLIDWHTVILFEDRSVLDITASQASRPEKDLIVKNYWSISGKGFPEPIIYFEQKSVDPYVGNIIKLPENIILDRMNYILEKICNVLNIPALWTYKLVYKEDESQFHFLVKNEEKPKHEKHSLYLFRDLGGDENRKYKMARQ